MSNTVQFIGFAIVAAATLTSPGFAGECMPELAKAQAAIDERIALQADLGASGKETTFATEGRQPTPDSMARAESTLGEGDGFTAVLAQLREARSRSDAGDEASCLALVKAARARLDRGP